jgi:hypothetical protein
MTQFLDCAARWFVRIKRGTVASSPATLPIGKITDGILLCAGEAVCTKRLK